MPSIVLGAENAGFVDGVWFGTQSFSTTNSVDIYTAVHNETDNTLAGQVIFTVDAHDLAPVSFSVSAHNLVRVSTNYTFAAGGHSVAARIINASAAVETASLPARTITVVAPAPTTPQEQVAAVGATVASAGTVVINTVSPIIESIADTVEKARDSLVKGPSPPTPKETSTPRGGTAPSRAANSIQNLFDVSLEIAGKSDVPLWRRGLGILLSVLAFLIRYWMWVLAVFVALVIWRIVRRR